MLFELKAQELSILYISHRMHEIEALADRCTRWLEGARARLDAGTAAADGGGEAGDEAGDEDDEDGPEDAAGG